MDHGDQLLTDCFIKFKSDTDGISLPEKFTFPFQYEPHPLSRIAAAELQEHLKTQESWYHNFGIEKNAEGLEIGKMFGVLVVQHPNGSLGYLAAFSGKLAGGNHHPLFVPPVFDVLQEDDFFRTGERELILINDRIRELENNEGLITAKEHLHNTNESAKNAINAVKKAIQDGKERRKSLRAVAQEQLQGTALEEYLEQLRKESVREQYYLKDLTAAERKKIGEANEHLIQLEREIIALKEIRKAKSSALQQQIFTEYSFLNQKGERKSLLDIFESNLYPQPPAGAGECAAPKLLHFAFRNGLKPVCMAEFWWGRSPSSEVRKHGHFYPACRGKCEPILSHMLEGIPMDMNPLENSDKRNLDISIRYEDDSILVIHKPIELLSVPGKRIQDSVLTRIRSRFPEVSGPLMVHRLDMSTSGLMIIAKNMEAYIHLQRQFLEKKIKKRYLALLYGRVDGKEGSIDLPLRVDLDNRPHQMVCHTHGKPALTHWKVIDRSENGTRIHFFPQSGRTHQLRVHAAHPDGLNAPILGDDLYGNKGTRLHLQADKIEFEHPLTGKWMIFKEEPEF